MNRFASLRKPVAIAGIVLLGAALAYAPVAAFHGDMGLVSKAGIAGAILVLIAWLLPAAPGPRTTPTAPRADPEPPVPPR